ncbi:50S ribosomal protein L3 [Endomicrobiia bacterium]|uniref:50S ribosomal protein L3 n=1 Tax=Endomicrobium trichonymphae TaxID=1408204 RepID=UPI000864D151|nr:50S ribosomal protein L3 [Candidatus Endomicrobium trichonymphae]GHT05132.1 50S ribosomal protein L3 [Endomicrobiia bacterium]BAV58647.1 50S ribosomal protein L3 [Candidatus Endomicrobium trichonymphae]GHT10090.1 50S ribosomal protein L3 [Endomicrobiia bacterium]GHT14468.1 50S ribosomal protein L3 [Endomicrobiia bacterium]GHT17209.1 50S ribosomal protein L3 [Endomicrobiia bacterium]
MLKFIIGKKIGMTQVFDVKGNLVPVTVVEVGHCVVTDVRTVEKNGYSAVQLGFGEIKEKGLNKAQAVFFKRNNLSYKRTLKEFRVSEVAGFSVGHEIKADAFKAGDYVDVSAVTKGKGYAGVIKRHNFGMQPVSHGQSDRTRSRGSSGAQGPQKVLKGLKMSGHMGNEYVTVQKLLIVNVDAEKNVLLIKGSVPSANRGTLFISSTLKKIPKVLVAVAHKGTKVKKK